MIEKIKLAFQRLGKIGYQADLPLNDQDTLSGLNQGSFCIVIFIIFIKYIGVFNIDTQPILVLLAILIALSIPVLNYYHKYFLAKLSTIVILPTYTFVLLILYGNQSGFQAVILIFAFIALLMFHDRKIRFLYALYPLLLILSGTYYNTQHPSIFSDTVQQQEAISFIVISIIIVFWLIESLRFISAEQIDTLHNYNLELEKQNQALQDLVKQNNTKTKLLSVVTHDLRGAAFTFNNLTKKINYLIKKNEPEKILLLGKSFEEKGEKLIYNIENLLSWIISQQERIEVDYFSTYLHKVVEDVIANIHFVSNQKSISIVNKINASTHFSTDINILKVIIHNLISNAIKYSPKGSNITIEFAMEANTRNITITDSGIGIPPKKLKLLQQQKDVIGKISNQGYGIGLSICFSFVKALKGQLIFNSRKEKGTVVTIQLPKSTNQQIYPDENRNLKTPVKNEMSTVE